MLDLYMKIDRASRSKLPAQPVVDLYAKLIAFGIRAAELFKSSPRKLFSLSTDEKKSEACDLAVIRHTLLTDIDPLITEVKAADDCVSKLIWLEYVSFAFDVQNGA